MPVLWGRDCSMPLLIHSVLAVFFFKECLLIWFRFRPTISSAFRSVWFFYLFCFCSFLFCSIVQCWLFQRRVVLHCVTGSHLSCLIHPVYPAWPSICPFWSPALLGRGLPSTPTVVSVVAVATLNWCYYVTDVTADIIRTASSLQSRFGCFR